MKFHSLSPFILMAMLSVANAQSGPSGKTLASTMDIYVFPKESQDAGQQSQDEASCYDWAAGNSGSDPFEAQKQQVAQAEQTEEAVAAASQTGRGAGVKGAVRGAVAGAVIGEIVDDDADDGAAIGATYRNDSKSTKSARSQG